MHFFRRLKSSVSGWFSRKNRPGTTIVPTAETAPTQGQPGLVCPQCAFRIQITIPMLLSGQPIYCTQCFLEFRVDNQKSQESLSALHKLQSDFHKAEEIIKQNTHG